MLSAKVLASILVTAVAVFLTLGGTALAQEQEELEDANVFIEWNFTDGDQGLQFFWDSEGFTRMMIFNTEEEKVLDLRTFRNVKRQGLTETSIESVEPEQSEQTLRQFFRRFPEGIWTFVGELKEGSTVIKTIEGEAELTHDLLEPVEFTKIKLPVIEWGEPETGIDGSPLEVVGYELVVELVVEMEVDGEEEERVFKEVTNYPAGFTKHIVGNRFMKLIKNPPGEIVEGKVEILADEPSGNRTISEEFFIEPED